MVVETSNATGSFSVMMPLTKVWRDENGEMWFEGVASSTRLDKQQERMTHKAIEAMTQQTGVQLLPSHGAGPLDELGVAEECWADNDRFRVAGRLYQDNPAAHRLFDTVLAGRRYGLSVGGRVTKAFWRYDQEAGRPIRHIDAVTLDHVALCRPEQAANPDTHLSVLAKAAEPITEDVAPEDGASPQEAETDVLAKIGRAAVQAARALWPFSKTAQDEGIAVPETTEITEELSKVTELRKQLEEMLDDVGEALAELNDEPGATAAEGGDGPQEQEGDQPAIEHGQPQSLPGQEMHASDGSDYWKGVL